MTDVAVPFPSKVDTLDALRIGTTVESLINASVIELDVSRVKDVEPFALVYLSLVADRAKSMGVEFRLRGADRFSYAAHMGLFRAFDSEYNSEYRGSENTRHITLKRVSRSELIDKANESFASHIGEEIESHANQYAQLLTQSDSGPVVDALTYCLREIMRNSFEHSGAEQILVSAQYRPASGKVEFAFGDSGCGIYKSIVRNPLVKVESASEAVRVALLPGVSGTHRPELGKSARRNDDPWRNTGYGLYMTHRICTTGGVFTIASDDALLRLTGGHVLSKSGTKIGTAVGLTIRLDQLQQSERLLREFNAEGSAMSKRIKGAEISASVASLTLRMTSSAGVER